MTGDPELRRRPGASAERRGSGVQRANDTIPNQPVVAALLGELGSLMELFFNELR